MKTRYALVSNSSSSSFVCLMPQNIYDDILNEIKSIECEEITPIIRKMINYYSGKRCIFGQNMVHFSYVKNDDSPRTLAENLKDILSPEEFDFLDDEIYDIPQEYIDVFEHIVKEKQRSNPENVFIHEEYC